MYFVTVTLSAQRRTAPNNIKYSGDGRRTYPTLAGGYGFPVRRLGLATVVAVVGVFVFAKQAFCNYYYFVDVALLCAAVTAPREVTS